MAQPIYDIIKDFGIPLATLVVGYFSGVRTTVYTDRRKEFNEIINDLYFKMKSQIECKSNAVEDFDIDVIELYIPWYKKRCFRKYAERYKNSQNGVSEYHPETGGVTVNEIAKLKMLKCASDVLHYVKPR